MIGDGAFGLVELVASFSLILGLLGWQWVSIRRTLRRDRDLSKKAAASPTPPPCGEGEGGGGSEQGFERGHNAASPFSPSPEPPPPPTPPRKGEGRRADDALSRRDREKADPPREE